MPDLYQPSTQYVLRITTCAACRHWLAVSETGLCNWNNDPQPPVTNCAQYDAREETDHA